MAVKWLFKFPPHPTSVSTLPGKTEQTKYALKWTTNVNNVEIRSPKNLMTVVWANEVHRLLTYRKTYFLLGLSNASLVTRSCFSSTADQRIGSRSDRTVGVRNLRLHLSGSVVPNSPDLNPVDYLSSGGSCNMQVYQTTFKNVDELRKQPVEPLKSGLVWSRTLLTLLSMHGETVCVLVFARRADISNIYCRQLNNWTVG